jgi:zinc and cadmium transporter
MQYIPYEVYTLISVLAVSMISLVGVLSLAVNARRLKGALFVLVSFSAGALLGDAFIHLLPEAAESLGAGLVMSLCIIMGIFIFFILEKIIHWRHCHVPTSALHTHPLGAMNLVGDFFHNFVDGMMIAASYLSSIPLGIATTIAVIAHEIPQEIGDFGILLHAGYGRLRALLFNFLSALAAVAGAIVTIIIGAKTAGIASLLVPFTAGGFIYIASSDIIPELHKECDVKKSVMQLIGIIIGIIVMIALLALG